MAGTISHLDTKPDDSISLTGHALAGRTFILGDGAGFVVYLPVEQNVRDRTLMSIKWFGASGFGRQFLEALVVSVGAEGMLRKLDRSDEIAFVQDDCSA